MHVRTYTLILCFVQTWKEIKPPSGSFICSLLAISLFIYNQENKSVLWLCFDWWQFLQFLMLNYWPLREKDGKLQRRLWPHISVEVQLIFDIFTPFGAMVSAGKACMPQWGCDDTIYRVCVGRVPPMPFRTPFRLLSPHQLTHTWLRPLGYTLLRIDVSIAPQASVP